MSCILSRKEKEIHRELWKEDDKNCRSQTPRSSYSAVSVHAVATANCLSNEQTLLDVYVMVHSDKRSGWGEKTAALTTAAVTFADDVKLKEKGCVKLPTIYVA